METKGIIQIEGEWYKVALRKNPKDKSSCYGCHFYKRMSEVLDFDCPYSKICGQASAEGCDFGYDGILLPLPDFNLILENKSKIAQCVEYEFTNSPRSDIQKRKDKIVKTIRNL